MECVYDAYTTCICMKYKVYMHEIQSVYTIYTTRINPMCKRHMGFLRNVYIFLRERISCFQMKIMIPIVLLFGR